jgi:hypothetical protein
MTTASRSAPNIGRAVAFEATLAAIVAACLLIQAASAAPGPLGVTLALIWSVSSALFAAQWGTRRIWALLGLAQLALSAWVANDAALVALWLPAITAFAVRILDARSVLSLPPTASVAPSDEHGVSLAPVAEVAGDRQHAIEWSQVHDAQGLRTVQGAARLTFRPGERQTELHLGFCPSFAVAPEFQCQQTSGPDVRIKTTQTMPYGVRLEVHRTDAAAWSVVALDFTAAVAGAADAPAGLRRAS